MKGFVSGVLALILFQSVAIAAPFTCKNGDAFVKIKKKSTKVTSIIKKEIKPALKKLAAKAKKRKLSPSDLKAKKALTKKLKTYEGYQKKCTDDRNFDENSLIKPEPISRIFTGNGLESIPFKMEALRNGQLVPVTCTIINQSANVSWNIDGCNGSITPLDHRTSEAHIDFLVKTQDGIFSTATGTLTFTFTENGNFIGDERSLAPYKQTLSDEEVVRLIRWAALGGNLDEALAINRSQGLDGVLDFLFAPKSCSSIETQALKLAKEDFTASSEWLDVGGGRTREYRMTNQSDFDSWTIQSLSEYWLHHIRYGCDPLREKMALFWQNHFGIGAERLGLASTSNGRTLLAKEHIDLLRNTFAGNDGGKFTPVTTLISFAHGRDGAQLANLNNENYYLSKTNENYARELLELFTMSPEDPVTHAKNYKETDIYDMTYALTGYQIKGSYVSSPPTHMCCTKETVDDVCPAAGVGLQHCVDVTQRWMHRPVFDKARWNDVNRPRSTFLFASQPFGEFGVHIANGFNPSAEDNVTPFLLNNHPGTGRYIAHRLIAAFATTDPTSEMIDQIANQLKHDNWKIDGALRTILRSSSFFSNARYEGVPSNIESVMSEMRLLNIPITKTYYRNTGGNNVTENLYSRLHWMFTRTGAAIMSCPSVFCWNERGKVAGKKTHNGEVFLNQGFIIQKQRGIAGYMSAMQAIAKGTIINDSQGFATYPSLDLIGQIPVSDRRNPGAIIDRFAFRLGIALSADERNMLLGYMNTGQKGAFGTSNSQYAIRWSSLSDADTASVLKIKIPGLIDLLDEIKTAWVR